MQIFVGVGYGWRKVVWDVESSSTIHYIKEIIEDKEGIPSCILAILCKGRLAFDNQTMDELNTTSIIYY